MGLKETFIFAKRVDKHIQFAKIPYFTVILYKIPLTSIALWAVYWFNSTINIRTAVGAPMEDRSTRSLDIKK